MKLTPIDIKKQEFKTSLRGYDRVEVDTYLEYVAETFEDLLQQNQKLEKEVHTLKVELRHYKDVEKTLKQTLYEVQQTSQLSKKTSEKEAELIKREAEVKARQMVEEAKAEVERIKRELAELQQQKDSLITRLRYLLSSQLELLEILEIDDKQLEKLKDKSRTTFKGSKRVAPKNEKIKLNEQRPAKKSEPEITIKADNNQNAAGDKKSVPVTNKTQPSKNDAKDNQKKKADFFKDIFGDELDDYVK